MKLTVEQEAYIDQYVKSKGLKNESLKDDVVDHLCCVIESNADKQKTFQQILDLAIADLAPNGLAELENRTFFLLNSKRILIMKKTMYLMGFIGSLILTAGITLKLLRMPYGSELFMAGFLILLLLFIPMLTIERYKVAVSKAMSHRLMIIMGGIAAVITGLSGLFKIMHLQGAEVLLMLGAFVFALGFLPFFFFTIYKKSIGQRMTDETV
ncbi:MAG: hypothetical protein AAFQ94_06165 [Bacteroidota bacterium]